MSTMPPLKMHTYTREDFGDRLVSSLEGIVDDPVQMLGQSRLDVGAPVHTQLDILSASRYPHGLIPGYDSDSMPIKRKEPHNNRSTTQQLYGGIFRKSPSEDVVQESSTEEPEPEASRAKKKARKSRYEGEEKARESRKEGEDKARKSRKEGEEKARKSRKVAEDAEESKRQRGRPRLDTEDQTAADRRRTQIRLAQRAYRNRKETTIAALKARVDDLQSTIEQMNKTFLDLHDNLIDSGVTTNHAGIAEQLQKATQNFVTLAKVSESDDDEEMTKIAEVSGKTDGSHGNRFESHKEPRTNMDRQERTPPDSLSDDLDVEELPATNSAFYMDVDSWSNMNNDTISFQVDVPQPPNALEVLGEKARNAAATLFPSIDYGLSSPQGKNGSYTYSFQETTFARRLHRRSLEQAWRNITNANIDPAVLNRTFRFTFCFSNRKRMVHRFKELLQRKAGEALENWNVPFFHIGGAGTHFPRIDQDGKPIYPPNMLSPEKALVSQNMGPDPWIGRGAETPRTDLRDVQAMLEAIGYGGEWFDSHDVEEYLKAKGIYLNGHSSFVEVDPSVIIPRVPTPTSSSIGSGLTSPTENLLRTPSPSTPAYPTVTDLFTQQEMNELYGPTLVTNAADFKYDEQDIAVFPPRSQEQMTNEQVYNYQIWPWTLNGSYPYYTDTDSSQPFTQQSTSGGQSIDFTHGFADVASSQAGPLTLDVEKFLERMVDGGACLGRAPGFRKDLVENALALSVSVGF